MRVTPRDRKDFPRARLSDEVAGFHPSWPGRSRARVSKDGWKTGPSLRDVAGPSSARAVVLFGSNADFCHDDSL